MGLGPGWELRSPITDSEGGDLRTGCLAHLLPEPSTCLPFRSQAPPCEQGPSGFSTALGEWSWTLIFRVTASDFWAFGTGCEC